MSSVTSLRRVVARDGATVNIDDLTRMRANLLFDGPDRGRKLSRFWVLLVAASVIASAGVVGDSTATVIGAMIVAPLMTPIMGAVLSIVTADRPNLVRSMLLVAGGAAAAIFVGLLFGAFATVHVVAETSSQVAGRVNPRIIDLLAALATGAVGAFAQCREDISDTLPGVAIAISLVPPLVVVGLTLEAGATDQAMGAMLLFATNVAAILLSGCAVMAWFRVHRVDDGRDSTGFHRRGAVVAVVVVVIAIAVPLTAHSVNVTRQAVQLSQVATVAQHWADDHGWRLVVVEPREGDVIVNVAGAPPEPSTEALRASLDDAGLADVAIVVLLTHEDSVELPGS
jgi:uncharacterized hydrophobic protein (TIGR00271 family)